MNALHQVLARLSAALLPMVVVLKLKLGMLPTLAGSALAGLVPQVL